MKTNPSRQRQGLAAALAALAVTFSGNSLAQSNVTLYGIVDSYLERSDHNPSGVAGQSGGVSSVKLSSAGLQASRWGVRGVEDLGSGLKALFVLEAGFNVDTGMQTDPGKFFNRQTFIGLDGRFGRATIGRQYTSLFDTLIHYMPLSYSGTYEPFIYGIGTLRLDNAAKYRVLLGSVEVQAHYGFGEQPGSTQGNAGWGASLNYITGPLAVGAAYDQVNGSEIAGSYPRTRKVAVGGRYAVGETKFYAGYRSSKSAGVVAATPPDDDMWWIGAGYQLTPSTLVSVAYYQDQLKTPANAVDTGNPKQFVVQGIYALSKRTQLYAAVAQARNAGLNFSSIRTLAAGANRQTGVALGIHHKF